MSPRQKYRAATGRAIMLQTARPLYRTATGIEIGGAYIRPPPAPSADAEAIQAALLRKRTADRFDRSLVRWGSVGIAAVLLLVAAGWL